MTDKQQRFADEYLVDCNGTRAYRVAYPNCKNDDVAGTAAARLLGNVRVREYIDQRLAEISNAKIADATEVMEYLTSVMRREHQETVVVTTKTHKSWYDEHGKKQILDEEEPQCVEIPARLMDANKAAELLGKRYALFSDKVQHSGNVPVVIVDDLGD